MDSFRKRGFKKDCRKWLHKSSDRVAVSAVSFCGLKCVVPEPAVLEYLISCFVWCMPVSHSGLETLRPALQLEESPHPHCHRRHEERVLGFTFQCRVETTVDLYLQRLRQERQHPEVDWSSTYIVHQPALSQDNFRRLLSAHSTVKIASQRLPTQDPAGMELDTNTSAFDRINLGPFYEEHMKQREMLEDEPHGPLNRSTSPTKHIAHQRAQHVVDPNMFRRNTGSMPDLQNLHRTDFSRQKVDSSLKGKISTILSCAEKLGFASFYRDLSFLS